MKELGLREISTIEAGNVFLPTFAEDYNRRFAREPRNPHDAHRPLQAKEDLGQIFTWHESRTMTRNLVVHYKRATYLIEATTDTKPLAGTKRVVEVSEDANGAVEIRYDGHPLPYSVYDKQPLVASGDVVENKRLGAAPAVIQNHQELRDERRLGSTKVTLRQKARLRGSRIGAGLATESSHGGGNSVQGAGAVSAYIAALFDEQRAKRKRHNDAPNQRKRDRELAASLGR